MAPPKVEDINAYLEKVGMQAALQKAITEMVKEGALIFEPENLSAGRGDRRSIREGWGGGALGRVALVAVRVRP